MNTTADNEDRLMRDAARLAREISPERDLWPEIEAEIGVVPARRRWPSYFAQAATVLALIGGSSFLTYQVTKTEPTVVEVPVVGEYAVRSAAFGGNYELGSGYRLAHSSLQTRMDRELAKLSPEAREGVEANLEVIREAIAEINAALEEEPGNVLLQELLMRAYREELSVMRKVGGLTQDVMLRNDI